MLIARLQFLVFAVASLWTAESARADFGLESRDGHHAIDTGAGLVFRIRDSDGTIDSIQWKGTELCGRKGSHIASGLGSEGTSVEARQRGDSIVVTVETDSSNGVVADFTHYYFVRRGENAICMATHAEKQPRVGELRWITRLRRDPFTVVPEPSDLAGQVAFVESKDVFRLPGGITRSKYYGNQRAKDLSIRGVAGEGIGVFMIYGNRESSSGGPFFRDIQNQSGGEVEVYNYMNSGHAQTEAKRSGVLYGPYALCFTDGGAPELPDLDLGAEIKIEGWVPRNRRGEVVIGEITGLDPEFAYTLGFANETAQYWADIAVPGGEARCSGMKPGRYKMTIYKGELAVLEEEVSVMARRTTRIARCKVTDDPSADEAVWRIGDWDGTPLEFRNGSKLSLMHPSDPRMEDWKDDDFVVGQNQAADFPCGQFADVNGSRVIEFELEEKPRKSMTVRIGITAAHAGGRPKIDLNQWKARNPPASSQPRSRAITIGTYRGNNRMYPFEVPSAAFVEGTNRLTIWPISGQGGSGFLSPGYTIDCVDLIR